MHQKYMHNNINNEYKKDKKQNEELMNYEDNMRKQMLKILNVSR